MNWDLCQHVWIPGPGDWDTGSKETSEVVCSICDCPGEQDDRTGEVFWPTT